MRTRDLSTRLIILLATLVLTGVYVLPIYVMVVTSLKTPVEISQRAYLIPTRNLLLSGLIAL